MKVILIGACGRMGRTMGELLNKKGYEFLGIDKNNRDEAIDFEGDIIIDFSSSACLKDNLELAEKKNLPIVIATTNHDENNLRLLNDYKENIAIFMASNFSIFFNVMLKFTKQLKMLSDCDFIVTETHHRHKKDSPSGSCKEIIKSLNKIDIEPIVSCYRVGEVVGEHSIKIYAENENLEISHQVNSREVFCEGAIKACEFLLTKAKGIYNMEDLLENLNL